MNEQSAAAGYTLMAGPDDSQRTPELPQDVVAAVLQHLSAKQRASSALVGHDWAAAAASLPSVDVSTSLADQHSCQHTQEWLLQNGGRVSSLQLAGRAIKEQPLLQLPCDGLTQLHSLYINRLQLALYSSSPGQVLLQHHGSHDDSCGCSAATPAAEAAAVLPPLSALAAAALLPQLQDLKVKQCALNMASLQLLSAVTSLTSLHLHGLLVTATAGDTLCTSAQTSSAVRQLLQHLPALTDLGLGTAAWEVVPVQFPAHRPALQRLTLGGGFACSTLAGLPAGLTFLHLQPCGSRCLHVDAGATRLTQLTSLRHLQLTKVDFPAALLSKMSALQRLTLSGAWVGSPFVGAEVHLPDASSKVQQLLAACRQLPQLQQLDFSYMNDSSVACALPVLTQLTALEITEQGMPVERGTLQNVLARKLPQLQVLRLVAEPQHTGPRRTYSWDHRDKPSCLDGSDMRSIPDNCPGLQHLSLLGVVGPSVFVGCIQSLSCLQELCLSGAAFKDQTAAAVAQISSLRSIQWSDSPLTIAGMQRLTALTGLTALEVGRCPAVAGLAGAGACSSGACSSNSTDGELKLQWMPQADRSPDLCRRLAWWCAHLHAEPVRPTSSPSTSLATDGKSVQDQQPSTRSPSADDDANAGKVQRRASYSQVECSSSGTPRSSSRASSRSSDSSAKAGSGGTPASSRSSSHSSDGSAKAGSGGTTPRRLSSSASTLRSRSSSTLATSATGGLASSKSTPQVRSTAWR